MEERSRILADLYRRRFDGQDEYRTGVWRVLCSDFFARFVPAHARVLDLGAGWGEFINNIEASAKFAMDLNQETGKRLTPGIRHFCQDCSQPWPLDAESLDVVFTSNFLEHLPDKQHIERAVAEAYRCLKPDGEIICLGPNIAYTGGHYWDFWDHQVPLTEASCAELLRNAGFSIERCIPRFLPYSMSSDWTPPFLFVKLYLRVPLLWRWWGKQFLIIGRKPRAAGRT